eukprot:jgi/Ulvmu1/10033/UM059_0082.1
MVNMDHLGPSLASLQPEILQVRHEDIHTPSTCTHPPRSPASPIPTARASSLRIQRNTPSAQLRTLLNSLVQLLECEYDYVFNHNLGVQSGGSHLTGESESWPRKTKNVSAMSLPLASCAAPQM